MTINLFTYDCMGCGACVACCPPGLLTMIDNGKCRFVNILDDSLCMGCKICELLCPAQAIRITYPKKVTHKIQIA